jgi:aminoglycoside phosphotransferase family enzyme/predicted kinase
MSTRADILEWMRNPANYPHQPQSVEVKQTHASWVFLAGSWVYKIKKPVDYGFLDYSTLEKRHHFCSQEVTLNSRLSPDVYLGIATIVRDKNGTIGLLDPDADVPHSSEILEYAVKMKRLDDRFFLHKLVREEKAGIEEMKRVADRLADFYYRQLKDDHRPEDINQWGERSVIRGNTDENFEQTEDFIGNLVSADSHRIIRTFTNAFLDQKKEVFEQRQKENRIVDGHGDLHLEHIHITGDAVHIYDCIEFNERFRYQDIAADVAFLGMDLDYCGRTDLAQYVINQLSAELVDPELRKLMDFYKCYRAMVRAKIEAFTSVEGEVPEEEQQEAAESARQYFNLALRYATMGSQPVALIFMGRIGTGKSTLADQLARKFQIKHYASDAIRKQLAGLPVDEMSPEEIREDLYSHWMSDKTYSAFYDRASVQLQVGNSVILDATFSRQHKRQELIDLFEQLNVPYYFIHTQAPDEVIKQRLIKRDHEENVVSDARLENFDTLNAIFESPEEVHPDRYIPIDTDQPLQDSLADMYEELFELHAKQIGLIL